MSTIWTDRRLFEPGLDAIFVEDMTTGEFEYELARLCVEKTNRAGGLICFTNVYLLPCLVQS